MATTTTLGMRKPVGADQVDVSTDIATNMQTLDDLLTGASTHASLKPTLESGVTINNPARTFKYTLVAAAIAAARTLNLPLLTATDTLAVLDLAQTLTNKTLTAPTIADLTNANHTHAAASSGGILTGAALPLHTILAYLIQSSGQQSFAALGPPVNVASTYATNTFVGNGFQTKHSGGAGAAIVSDSGTAAWSLSTGTAGSGALAGFNGPMAKASRDWTFTGRFYFSSASNMSFVLGAKTTVASFADENGLIGFRVAGTGNMFFVSDSGGTETTRDSGATKAGGWHTFEVRSRSGGTILQGLIDNVQIGADITDNIPTGSLNIAAGVQTTDGSNKACYLVDLHYWEEN